MFLAVETILEVVRRYEANRPEILHKAFVINGKLANSFFMINIIMLFKCGKVKKLE